MKSKQLLTKAISKSTALLMIGATVIASGAGMNVYAKDIKDMTNIKVTTYKTSYKDLCSSNNIYKLEGLNDENCDFNTLPNSFCRPNALNNSSCKPDDSCPENSKPESSNSGTDNSQPEAPSTPNTPDIDDTKPNSDSTLSTQAAFENKVLELVNVERAKAGLNSLQMDESVRDVARLKSEDMRVNRYFDHTSPTYGSPYDMLKQFGISYRSAGENIAQGYTTPEQVVTGWMNSSGHRANILSANFTHIGVGYDSNGDYWTQMFIGK